MAEGIFRQVVKERGDYRVISAGLGAMEGQPPSIYAVQAVRELGIDISGQRSRMLTPEMVEDADYIFGMTHSHIDTVMLLYPQAAEKTFLLREFDETLDVFEKDISDPIGGSYEVYLNCRDQIEQGIASLIRFIEQGEGAAVVAANRTATIAIGADHGGYELKESIKARGQRGGLRRALDRIGGLSGLCAGSGADGSAAQSGVWRVDLHDRGRDEHRRQQSAWSARGAGGR